MTAADELLQDSPAARPCLHPVANHQHGTRNAYQLDGCRCTPCTQANSAYKKTLRQQTMKYGRWATWVDAGPVRAHIQDVMAQSGLSPGTIATRSGLAVRTVQSLLYGAKGRPPSRRLSQKTAEALFAISAVAGQSGGPPGLWNGEPK